MSKCPFSEGDKEKWLTEREPRATPLPRPLIAPLLLPPSHRVIGIEVVPVVSILVVVVAYQKI